MYDEDDLIGLNHGPVDTTGVRKAAKNTLWTLTSKAVGRRVSGWAQFHSHGALTAVAALARGRTRAPRL